MSGRASAVTAWESLFRAQVSVMRTLAAEFPTRDISFNEYDVMFNLTRQHNRELRLRDLNKHVLPPDVKVVPFYDRHDLIAETTRTVERNLLRGMLLVLVILGLMLLSVRTALIVAVTIPFALLFSFICLDWRHIPANLLSIGAIDFGIIVDGAVVMVENVFRELANREDQQYNLVNVIRSAARDVESSIHGGVNQMQAELNQATSLDSPSASALPNPFHRGSARKRAWSAWVMSRNRSSSPS